MDKILEFFNKVIYPISTEDKENPTKRVVCLDCVCNAVKKFIEENYDEKTDKQN